jgi:hypothetical protein
MEKFKKASTEDTNYTSGAIRDGRVGKGAPNWMPQSALFLVSRIYENGNLSRGIRNWEKGMPIEDYLASAQRHISKYLAGFRDEPHIPMAIWNLLNALQTSIWVKLGLRPKELNTLPDHLTGREMGEIDPLCPQEIEWLTFWGIEFKKPESETLPAAIHKVEDIEDL